MTRRRSISDGVQQTDFRVLGGVRPGLSRQSPMVALALVCVAARAVVDEYEDRGLVHVVDYEDLTEKVYALRSALDTTRFREDRP